MYLQEVTADVRFIFNQDGEELVLPAHKAMLASESSVFHSMFYGILQEEGNVVITDCRFESFKEFLQFFYLASVTLTMENIDEVMNMVNKYDVTDCFKACEQLLMENFTMEIACWEVELAVVFNRIDLRQRLLTRMMKAPNELFATDSFKKCTRNVLKLILGCEQKNCDEKAFFDACIDWAESSSVEKMLDPLDMMNLREQLGDCLYLIQFAAMSNKEINECISKYSDLFSKEELIDIIAVMASSETGHNMDAKYFVHRTRANISFKPTKFLYDTVTHTEKISLVTNKKAFFRAFETHRISHAHIGEFQGLMKMYGIDQIFHQQHVVLIVNKPMEETTRNYIQLSRPVVLEPGIQYYVKFKFSIGDLPKEVFVTLKSNERESLSVNECTVVGKFGFFSNLYLGLE